MTASVKAKAGKGVFVVLGIFSALFILPGIFIALTKAEGWQLLAVECASFAIPWAGALSVRFRYDEKEISYHSLFRHFSVWTEEVRGIEIGVERTQHVPQGAPRFYLVLRDGRRQMLNARILPPSVVRAFCAMLVRRGVSVQVADAYMAKRFASQIFTE
ncbi:hypothetical protein BH09VER1_BH09VER1_13570 [soil metagenome]